MKITKLLLLVVAALAFACSGDDDEPSLEKRTLSFSGDEQVITAPAAMQSVENYAAQAAVDMIDEANFMSTYLSMMQIPSSGASKGSERITASNGRVNAAGDFVVYTWDDGQGNQVAYQISETSDSYVFEIFFFVPDLGEGWTKLFQAQEKKDRSSGSMVVYNIYGSEDLSDILFSYAWERSGDNFTLTMSVPDEETTVVLVMNEKTKAGSVTSTVGGQKHYEITWDAAGNGTYVYYDEEGSISDEGSWTA